MGFVDPEIAANVVFAGKLKASPELAAQRDEMVQEMIKDGAPYRTAGMPYLHDVIDPRETRDYIIQALEISQDRRTGGIGAHHLANWPTKF
jgi:acetyl-CoA carboxylase carboxyltransferase component